MTKERLRINELCGSRPTRQFTHSMTTTCWSEEDFNLIHNATHVLHSTCILTECNAYLASANSLIDSPAVLRRQGIPNEATDCLRTSRTNTTKSLMAFKRGTRKLMRQARERKQQKRPYLEITNDLHRQGLNDSMTQLKLVPWVTAQRTPRTTCPTLFRKQTDYNGKESLTT